MSMKRKREREKGVLKKLQLPYIEKKQYILIKEYIKCLTSISDVSTAIFVKDPLAETTCEFYNSNGLTFFDVLFDVFWRSLSFYIEG